MTCTYVRLLGPCFKTGPEGILNLSHCKSYKCIQININIIDIKFIVKFK